MRAATPNFPCGPTLQFVGCRPVWKIWGVGPHVFLIPKIQKQYTDDPNFSVFFNIFLTCSIKDTIHNRKIKHRTLKTTTNETTEYKVQKHKQQKQQTRKHEVQKQQTSKIKKGKEQQRKHISDNKYLYVFSNILIILHCAEV